MKISVIIPCHNAGPWIGEALDSVARQTYQPHEVIVIDDGSTDNSLDEVKRTGIATHILKVNNGNAAATRNAGIEIAGGNWIAFLDADDIWYPHHLEQAYKLLAKSSDCAYFAAAEYQTHNGETRPGPREIPSTEATTNLTQWDFLRWFSKVNSFCNCTVLLLRERVQEIGGFDESLRRRHDFELFMRAIVNHSWAYHPNPSMRVRCDTPGSISRNTASCAWYSLKAMLKNESAYHCPEMTEAIRRRARIAMGAAIASGDAPACREAWDLAQQHLSLGRWLYYYVQTLRYLPRKRK